MRRKVHWRESSTLRLEHKDFVTTCVQVIGGPFSCIVLEVSYAPGGVPPETLLYAHLLDVLV